MNYRISIGTILGCGNLDAYVGNKDQKWHKIKDLLENHIRAVNQEQNKVNNCTHPTRWIEECDKVLYDEGNGLVRTIDSYPLIVIRVLIDGKGHHFIVTRRHKTVHQLLQYIKEYIGSINDAVIDLNGNILSNEHQKLHECNVYEDRINDVNVKFDPDIR